MSASLDLQQLAKRVVDANVALETALAAAHRDHAQAVARQQQAHVAAVATLQETIAKGERTVTELSSTVARLQAAGEAAAAHLAEVEAAHTVARAAWQTELAASNAAMEEASRYAMPFGRGGCLRAARDRRDTASGLARGSVRGAVGPAQTTRGGLGGDSSTVAHASNGGGCEPPRGRRLGPPCRLCGRIERFAE